MDNAENNQEITAMPPDRIAYVLWPTPGPADAYATGKVNQWNAHAPNTHHQHDYDLVFHGDVNAKATIRSLPRGHRLYILGHGAPGYHYLHPASGPSNALKYDEVADNLIADGLQKRWAGVIVCDNCSSAVPKLGMQSFARKFADYMRFKGYLLISFVGYFGAIDSEYSKDGIGGATAKYEHRYVTVFGGEVKSKFAMIHL